MNVRYLAVLAVLLASATGASGETQAVERTAKGEAGKDIRVGVYVNVQPDCSSGPLPTIRLASPPQHGKLVVKSGKIRATNYKQCLAIEVPAYVAFYKSERDFSGADVATLEIKFPNGRTEIQRITITVGRPQPSQGI